MKLLKKIIVPFLIIIVLGGLESCIKSEAKKEITTGVQKYSVNSMRESPYADLKGAILLSDEEASSRLHTVYTFDAQGRVSQVVRMLGDQTYHEYNAALPAYFPSVKIEYTYGEGTMTLHYFDHNQQPISIRGDVFRTVYSLDDQGHKTGLKYYDTEGNHIENSDGVASYSWYKNEKGLVVEKRFNLKGELMPLRPNFLFYETHLEYDKDGYVQKMYNYGKEGKLTNNETGVAVDVIEYNKDGIFIGWSVYDKEMKPVTGNNPRVHRGKFTLNKYGHSVKTAFFDIKGERMLNYQGIAQREDVFNDRGLIIEQRVYDLNGPLNTHPSFPPVLQIKRDENGNNIEMAAFDADGNRVKLIQESEISFYKMSYDKNRNILEQSFFGVDGAPNNIPQLRGGHKVIHSYDGLNHTKSVIIDKDGKQLN